MLSSHLLKRASSSSSTLIISSSVHHYYIQARHSSSTIEDDLLLNSTSNVNGNKKSPLSSSTLLQTKQKPASPFGMKKAPMPPGGGMVRPKLMMKNPSATQSQMPLQLKNSKTTTASPPPQQQKISNSSSPPAPKPRISLKSVNTGQSNVAEVKKQEQKQQQQQQQQQKQEESSSSSTENNNNTTIKKKEVVSTSDDAILSTTMMTISEQDLATVVEACELIIPAQGGLAVVELFSILTNEDRSIIRKSSFKLLSKFLRAFPEKFAVSPNNVVVTLVSAFAGDKNKAFEIARISESVTPTSVDFSSAPSSISTSKKITSSAKTAALEAAKKKEELMRLTLKPLSKEDLEDLTTKFNQQYLKYYNPVTAADELNNIELKSLCAGEHHNLKLDGTPLPDLVCLSTASGTQPDGRIRTPTEFKNSVDEIFETTLSTQTLVKFVPPWFVPAKEVVVMMGEGYTEEHFEQFFGDSAAVEVVTLLDQKFVRLHGGNKHKTLVDFDNAEAREAEKLFQHYKPDPALVPEILKVCPPRGQWISLFDMWNRLPKETQEKFPFQGPHALTYFAQMQHIFSFSPNDGGGVCIPMGLPGHLQWDSTPFVKPLHAIFNSLLNGKMTLVSDLLDAHFPKHSPSRKILREPFLRGLILARAVHGSGIDPEFAFTCDVESLEPQQIEDLMRVFVSLHQNIFAYKEESMLAQSNNNSNNSNNFDNNNNQPEITPATIQNKLGRSVCLRFEYEAMERHNLDIPEQIEIAKQRGNNKMVRKLKRKLLILQQPDNPYLEEENLAKAISEFLPPDRSIAWPRLKKNLPQEIIDLIPADRKKFMTKWSNYFKKFDVGVLHNHNIHLQLPHLPPPPGAFRQAGEYTEDELLSAMGQVLLRGPKNVASLCSALPDGIYDSLRLKFGGVAQAVQKHPQYFALIIKDVRNKDLRTAIVTLIQVPNLRTVEDNLVESERAAEENRNLMSEMGKESVKATGFDSDRDNDSVSGFERCGNNSEGGEDVWGKVISETVSGDESITAGVKTSSSSSDENNNSDDADEISSTSSTRSSVSYEGNNTNDIWTKAAMSNNDDSEEERPEGKSEVKKHDDEFVSNEGW